MHFLKYTRVDAKAILDLEEDRAVGSRIKAGLCALGRAASSSVTRALFRVLDVGCCCRPKSRQDHPSTA